MRLLRLDPTTGEFRLRLETPSDLWRVARFIRPGEVVGARTSRRDPEAPVDTPSAQRERRSVWLSVRAESVEFHDFSHHVRVSGPIVAGPFDLGHHHTLDVAEGDEVVVVKPVLTAADRSLLEEGKGSADEAPVLIAAVDWGDAALARLRGRVVEPVAEIRRTIPGKRYAQPAGAQDRTRFLDELKAAVVRGAEGARAVVVAGPGFLKEELVRSLAEGHPGLRGRLHVVPAAESGAAGISEVLRGGRATELLRGAVVAEEAALIERWVAGLGADGRSVVGVRETGLAVDAGAVDTMLVLDSKLTDPSMRPILDAVDRRKVRLFIVRDAEGPGVRLRSLGGVGALLRYRWTAPPPGS